MVSPSAFAAFKFIASSNVVGWLDGQIAGPGALEDLVDVGGSAAHEVRADGAVGDEPAAVDVLRQLVHDGQPVLRREGDDPVDMKLMDGIARHEER